MTTKKKIAIIGAGAAGCFCAANIMEMKHDCEITLFEATDFPLHKLSLTGGGRCNLTNSFNKVTDLADVYPRGHRLLRRLFYVFGHEETHRWFLGHGIPLYTQPDQRVFPFSNRAVDVVECLLYILRNYHVKLHTRVRINSISWDNNTFTLHDSESSSFDSFNYVIVTIGGMTSSPLAHSLLSLGHELIKPIPSLFSFKVSDCNLQDLSGISVPSASVLINGSGIRAEGALLVTHFGLSGPAILSLSSYAARILAERNYNCDISINWTGLSEQELSKKLNTLFRKQSSQNVYSSHPDFLPNRLWIHLLSKAGISRERTFGELGKKNINRLLLSLLSDTYHVTGRGQHRDEFVTCGGISLRSINNKTLESKVVPRLYFAGEILDIDAHTGGFNLQSAWTTAFVVANHIANE